MVLLLAAAYAYHNARKSAQEVSGVVVENAGDNDEIQNTSDSQNSSDGNSSSSNSSDTLLDRVGSSEVVQNVYYKTDKMTWLSSLPDNPLQEAVLAPPEVRNDWVNAVFGPSFFPPGASGYSPPRQGVGLAQIPSYVAYRASIPKNSGGEKLGMTLSRLSLGLYVQSVQPGSEASLAGIEENSILVAINGMGILGEPSRQALERIWQYEGLFVEDQLQEEERKSVAEPVALKFIKNGRLYTVLLLSRPPWGIRWGPCGDFCLVNRSYAYASSLGVRRGSLVVAVNNKSLREMSHVEVASDLKRLFRQKKPIELTFAFTPAAARTGHFERGSSKKMCKKRNGVEVRVHSLEESLSVFFGSAPCGSCAKTNSHAMQGSVTELAIRVSNRELIAPQGFELRQHFRWSLERVYGPCPTLSRDQLMDSWAPMPTLVFLLRFHQANHNELHMMQQYMDPRKALRSIGVEAVDAFLLQFISLISHSTDEHRDEGKSESMGNEGELSSILLSLSRRDLDFSQRLFLMLRSFIGTFEHSGASRKCEALLNCLDLLRSAEVNRTDRQEEELGESKEQHAELISCQPSSISTLQSTESLVSKPSESSEKRRRFRFFRWKKKRQHSPVAATVAGQIRVPQQDLLVESHAQVLKNGGHSLEPKPLFENMSAFLDELDSICNTIEKTLLRSFSAKIADWALQPWSASKGMALADVTSTMRSCLGQKRKALVNPLDSTEILLEVDQTECYVLPSAHFPLLMTFNARNRNDSPTNSHMDRLYQCTIELVDCPFVVHAAMSGAVEAGKQRMTFKARSWWGPPQTLSIRVSKGDQHDDGEAMIGFGWIDLKPLWRNQGSGKVWNYQVSLFPQDYGSFDEQGAVEASSCPAIAMIECKITAEIMGSNSNPHKRMLLYKHDDDLRQEAFAIQFVKFCDDILKANGLDLSILTFRCIPVGAQRGFIEWIHGSIPLSEICNPALPSDEMDDDLSMTAKAGLKKHGSLLAVENRYKHDPVCNPIQDFLRSVAYDPGAPYWIDRTVMDTYVKSCAGYCVITYVLGVGDRHLDNLLIHPSGRFFHCDFSFLFCNDPKKYLPIRVTEDMVNGMGGRESDNYAKFLTLAGATFLTLRRPENVRSLLSLVRLMDASRLPDLKDTMEAIVAMRRRLRLDLSEEDAVEFIDNLICTSISSKLWMAVDAIHSFGKRF